MNHRLKGIYAALLLLPMMGGMGQESTGSTITGPTLRSCPDGHPALRAIPIRYGLEYMMSARHEDWKDLDYVPGGCLVGSDSPTSMIICRTCGFRNVHDDNWLKDSTSLHTFGIPFSNTITNLVALYHPTNAVSYSQQVERSVLLQQRAFFRCEEDARQLRSELAGFMRTNAVAPLTSRYVHEVFLGIDTSSRVHQVWLMPDQGKHYLSYTIYPKAWLDRLERQRSRSQKPRQSAVSNGGDGT